MYFESCKRLSQYFVSRLSVDAIEILEQYCFLEMPPFASTTLAPIEVPHLNNHLDIIYSFSEATKYL